MTTDVTTKPYANGGFTSSFLKLKDIVDLNKLSELMNDDRISRQSHPTLPLFIYNYTSRAQFLNKWTNEEIQCRGLITDAWGNVIARGPAKFFNYGQPGAPELSMDSLTRVTTKHDGSLGIGWTFAGEFGIATRGSFTSDQAKHATAMMTDEIEYNILSAAEKMSHLGGMTPCYEIVYKENRIVLDYGDRDELFPLGWVGNQDGKIRFRPESMYVSPVITLAEAIARAVPDDEEGYVLDVQPFGGQEHIKLKGERYMRLHALITNTSGQRIWVELAARACEPYLDFEKPKRIATLLGQDPVDILRVDRSKSLFDDAFSHVPDEFYDWFMAKVQTIENNVHVLITQALKTANEARTIEDRRERFEFLKDDLLSTEIMRYIDNEQLDQIVLKAWKLSKPSGLDTPFRTQEDV